MSRMSEKKITIQDIARTAGVSKSTVSRVLNNSTPVNEGKRRLVLEAMKGLDFKPNVFARSLAGGCSMTIGVITQKMDSPFFSMVTTGLIEGLTGSDYSPIFVDGQWRPDQQKAAINTLLDRNVDGLIMLGGDLESEVLTGLVRGKPTVIVAKQLKGWQDHSVAIDNFEAARRAVQYLLDQGHQKIAHIGGILGHDDAQARYKGYFAAMQQAEIKSFDDLFVEGDFSSMSGVLAVENLLSRGISFTAIFAANDEMAYGARLALYRQGIRVPDDVSIVGFDDQPNSAYMTPPLTTVAQPAVEMGIATARIILGKLNHSEYEVPVLPAQLVIRESVARID